MTKRLLVIGTAVMTTVLALVALWQFRIVILYVIISLVLAATFRPISKSETRQNLSTRLRLILQYVVGFGIAALLIYLAGRFLVGDFQQLGQTLSEQSAWLLPTWLEGSAVQQAVLRWLPAPDRLLEELSRQPLWVLSTVLGITEGIGAILGGLVIVFILSVYWSINQNHFERLWLSLLPGAQRKRARYIWQTAGNVLGAYSRSEIIQAGLAAVLLGLGYWLLGSPYPTLLAVTGAIAWLIPVIGGALALILPLLLGPLTSPQLGLVTALYTLVVLVALEVWIKPRLFSLKSDNPILTFVILLAMADAFGLLGIIVAPPLSVIIQILWRLLISDRLAVDTTVHVSDLRERQARLQTAIEEMDGPPPPLVVSSMERLAKLLEKSEPLLEGLQAAESPDRPGSP